MLRARLLGLLLALAATGCHTISAGRALFVPSPIGQLDVEAGAGQITWIAQYRDDVFLRGPFARGVPLYGSLALAPEQSCALQGAGPQHAIRPWTGRVILFFAAPLYPQGPDRAEPLIDPRCAHVLRVRASAATGQNPGAGAIEIVTASGALEYEVALPPERPALEPRRYAQLLLAPARDAVFAVQAVLVGALFGLVSLMGKG